MPRRVKIVHPTLKHGGYSAKTVLPGESRSGFKRLHRGVIAELCPDGAIEHEIVRSIAQLVWRKQNLGTFRKVELLKQRYQAIRSEYLPRDPIVSLLEYGSNKKTEENKPQREGGLQAAEDQARKELGRNYQLVEIGDTATVESLMRELEIEERLDAMIDRQLKRLLLLRGIKSLPASSSTPPNSLPAPGKAA